MNLPGETLLDFIARVILRRRGQGRQAEEPVSLAPQEPSYVLSPYRAPYPCPPEPEPAGPYLEAVWELRQLKAASGVSSEEAARAFNRMNRSKDP